MVLNHVSLFMKLIYNLITFKISKKGMTISQKSNSAKKGLANCLEKILWELVMVKVNIDFIFYQAKE